jgi:hypothetical protein
MVEPLPFALSISLCAVNVGKASLFYVATISC